jgi:hypothetical protein
MVLLVMREYLCKNPAMPTFKKSHFAFFLLFSSFAVFLDACSPSKSASSANSNDPGVFIAPGYVKKDYKKILVLAKAQEPARQKLVEDAVAREFKSNGYKVIPAYTVVSPELLKDSARLRSVLEGDGFDAAIVATYLGKIGKTIDQYRYSGTMYSVFYGAAGVFDLETRNVETAYVQLDFFVAGKLGTQFRSAVGLQLYNNLDATVQQFSIAVRKQLVGSRIL